jgi:hypothetical protein
MTYVATTVSLTLEVDFDTDGKQVKISKAKVAKALTLYLQDLVDAAAQGDSGFEENLSDATGWCVKSWTLTYDEAEKEP